MTTQDRAETSASESGTSFEDGNLKRIAPESGLFRLIRSGIVLLMGLFSAMYLFNFGAGFIELIPDNIPGIGNLDEAFFTLLLVSCAGYFGFDIRPLIGPLKEVRRRELEKRK